MPSRPVTDVKLLRKALKIGSILGIFPRISTKHHVTWCIYSSLFGVVFFIWYAWLLFYYQTSYSSITNVDVILDYVDVLMLIVFNTIYLKTSLKYRKQLDRLSNNLSKMSTFLTIANPSSDKRLSYCLAILASILWISVAFFSYIESAYLQWYVSFSVFATYNAVWIYCLHQICLVIRSCFISLEKYIEQHFPEVNPGNSRANISILTTGEKIPAFKRIVKINVLIDDSVKITNSVFGGMILALFCKVYFNIMNAFKGELVMINKDRPFKVLLMEFPYIFQSAFSLTFAIIVILACDNVQNAHVAVIAACRKRLAYMKDATLTKELAALIAFMENLPPKFTAAGFFRITRGLLSSFSSTLISYLIVILQFKLASKSEQ